MLMPPDVPENKVPDAPLLDDRSSLLTSVGGQVELLREIVGIYMESVPRLLLEVRTALERGNQTEVILAAHKLAGTVSSFYSTVATAVVVHLERQARAGDLAGAAVTLPGLEKLLVAAGGGAPGCAVLADLA